MEPTSNPIDWRLANTNVPPSYEITLVQHGPDFTTSMFLCNRCTERKSLHQFKCTQCKLLLFVRFVRNWKHELDHQQQAELN